jgi:hypothetical protein
MGGGYRQDRDGSDGSCDAVALGDGGSGRAVAYGERAAVIRVKSEEWSAMTSRHTGRVKNEISIMFS